jgi:uncharacterized repeat protein (TIGR02543 family)
VASESVLNGNTVSAKKAPTLKDNIFEGWNYTPTGADKPVKFVFDSTKVTEDLKLTAEWTPAQAYIGDTLYHTLEEAAAAAKANDKIGLLQDVTLKNSISVVDGVTFAFDNFKVISGDYEITAAGTLSIEGGIFEGGKFAGTKVAIKGGSYLGTVFTTALEITGGKFDAKAARPINANQLATVNDLILAVTTSDGYYTPVEKWSLTFDFAGARDNATIPIGLGETPVHAVSEAVATGKLAKDTITNPEPWENKRFDIWSVDTAGKTPFDLTAAYAGVEGATTKAQTVTAQWVSQATVTFKIYDKVPTGEGYEQYTQKIDIGSKAATVDPTEFINEHNKEADLDNQDVFECWETFDGKEFNFGTKIEADTQLRARMKSKVVFDYQDATIDPVLIHVIHGDKLIVYKDQIPEVVEGSDGWVDDQHNALNTSDIINYDRTFYPLYADKENWELIDFFPRKGFTYTYDEETMTGTGIFVGTAREPIVLYAQEKTMVGFEIEAPSAVKETDAYEVQFDNGSWKEIKPIATLGADAKWDGRTINNNLKN